ncbi:hypothetical protein QTJ16_006513 [Diplocarpon rosae]|uniref:Uncharacterized protein n=1 Tax=Diplocarpon rosae TaxID=946125 RepID=A0AAD9SVH9_9HELO|nr:hypothetical protein QTJ16_006513 [Diplocarpon rosae]
MSKTPFFPRPTQSLPPGAFEDSVANSPTPGPSSKGKGKERQGRSKDTRDFSNPDVLRGTFQAMEQTQKSQYENSQTAINHLRDEIRNLTQLMAANLKPELPTPIPGPSAETNRVVPTIERASTQPISDRNTNVHADSNTRKIKIQLTEKIFPLDDGNDPSFKQ